MSDEQTIFRAHRTERDKFTPLLNDTIRDPRLSFRATGLLVYLLSLPGDWKANQKHITSCKTEGRDAVIAAWNELRKFGYMDKELIRKGGRIVATVWNIYETPYRPTEKPETVKPETVQPVPVNPALQKTDLEERQIDEPLCEPAREQGEAGAASGQGNRPASPFAFRIDRIFNRRITTSWQKTEKAAFRDAHINEEDLALVEIYYRFNRKKPDAYCRTSHLTLLRHWAGEVDRARAWAEKNPSKFKNESKPKAIEEEPAIPFSEEPGEAPADKARIDALAAEFWQKHNRKRPS